MRAAVLVWAGLCAVRLAEPAQQTATRDTEVFKDLERRVADYVRLHSVVRAEVHGLKPTTSSQAIERHEHRLANRIRELRRGVGEGCVFTAAIAAEFRRRLAITMQGPEGGRIRESLERAAPVRVKAIRVNQTYPSGVPLQSTPPSILMNLPPLPPEVEYRVVGHSLVLRDIEANLIVDFIPNAIS